APKKSNQQLLQVTVNKRITERQKKFSHTVLLYWLVLAVIYAPAAELFLQAGYFALLAAIFLGGLIGLAAGLAWIRVTLGPGETKRKTK
ncbi:MAG: hypothetical protein JXA11_09225, partial [Phycisphaerae bacterium]|nr:hypothetical protein [Phycisphaerae bacterium]